MADATDDDHDLREAEPEKQGETPAGVSRRMLLLASVGTLVAGSVGGFFAGRSYTLRGLRKRRRKRPSWPAYVPVESWTPRHGAAAPTVTIVVFNDFQ